MSLILRRLLKIASLHPLVSSLTAWMFSTVSCREVYDSLLRYTKAPRLLILVHCPFEEIMRRIHDRGREDEVAAGEEYWRMLYNAYAPFIDFVKMEMEIPNFLVLDLSDPNFIRTPERVDRFLDEVRAFFPERFGEKAVAER